MPKVEGGNVRWVIEGDNSKLIKSLKDSKAEIQNFGKSLGGLDKEVKTFSNGIASVADGMQKVLVAAQNEMSATIQKISQEHSKFLQNTQSSAQKAQQEVVKATGNAWTSIGGFLNNTGNLISQTSQRLSGLTGVLQKIATRASALAGGIAVAGLKGGLQLQQQIEGARTGLSFILKDGKKAEGVMQRIKKEALRTPFNVSNLAAMAQKMAVFTKNGDKAVDVLLAMGGATVASGKSMYDLELSVINLGQAFNNAWTFRDYKEMLNHMPVFKMVADEYGLTWERMKEIQKSGTQNLGELLTQMLAEWGAKNDVFNATANNTTQLLERLKESFQLTFLEALESSGGIEIYKETLKKLTQALDENKGKLSETFVVLGDFIKKIDLSKLIDGLLSTFTAVIQVLQTVLPIVEKFFTVLGGGDLTKGIERFIKFALVANTVNKVFNGLGGAISGVGKIVGWFGKETKSGSTNAEVLVGVGKSVTQVFPLIAKGALLALGGLKTLGAGIMAIPGWGWLIAAIAGVVAGFIWLWNNVEEFRNFFMGIWDGIVKASQVFFDVLKVGFDVLSGVFQVVVTIVNGVASIFVAVFTTIWGVVSKVFDGIMAIWNSVLKPVFSAIIYVIKALFTIWWTIFSGIVEVLWTVGSTVVQIFYVIIVGTIKAVWGIVKSILEVMGALFLAIFNGIWEVVSTVFNTIKDIIVGAITIVWEVISKIVGGFVEFFSNIFNSILKTTQEVWGWIWDKISGFVNKISDTVKGGLELVKTWVIEPFQKALDWLGNIIGEFAKAGKNIIDGIVKGIKDAKDAVVNTIKNVCKGALDAVKNFFGIKSPSKLMRKMFNYVGDGMVEGLQDSQDKVLGTAKTISSGVANALNQNYGMTVSATGAYSPYSTANVFDGNGAVSAAGGVVINQTNNNYTQFSIDQLSRDLHWELSKI